MRRILPKITAFLIVNLVSSVALAQPVNLPNPLGTYSFATLIERIAGVATMIALPVIVLFIVYAGFLYVTARGNESKVKKAHDTLLWSVVGAAIILGAYVIAAAINEFAQGLRR